MILLNDKELILEVGAKQIAIDLNGCTNIELCYEEKKITLVINNKRKTINAGNSYQQIIDCLREDDDLVGILGRKDEKLFTPEGYEINDSNYKDLMYERFVEQRGSKNVVFYKSNMYCVGSDGSILFLHANSFYDGKIVLPINASSCYRMFAGNSDWNYKVQYDLDTRGIVDMNKMFSQSKLLDEFTLGDKFDTRNVIDMGGMFAASVLPIGFTLGDNFDTSNVKAMEWMFSECELPYGFTLGDKFDTGNVQDMYKMFHKSGMPEDFTLGDKFDTRNVEGMRSMFSECELPKGFTLGDKFDTSNVKGMRWMFFECTFPEGFTLGRKFDTSKVGDMNYMFCHCTMSEGFTLGDKFDTSNVTDMSWMFDKCVMPEGFTLGEKFNVSKVDNMQKMFSNCRMPDGTVYKGTSTPKEIIEKLGHVEYVLN